MKKNNKYWWLVLLKGAILIILSIYIFQHPVSTLVGLAWYIGISLLFTGAFIIVTALSVRKANGEWNMRLIEGIIDVIFALVLLSNPNITAAIFPFIIGFWLMIYGIILFVDSFNAKKAGASDWWSVLLSGLFAVVIGYFISSNILVGAIAITVWIAIGVLIFGIVNVSISLWMRKELATTE